MKSFSKKSISLVLIFTVLMAIFMPTMVSALSDETTYTVTYDLNGGSGEVEPFTVSAGTFILPELPEYPVNIRDTVISPEGKWYDAFEIDGKRYEFGEEIEVTKDTTIKYLWKDVIYIHRIDATFEAPIVGTLVEAEYRASSGTHDPKTQTNRPIVNVPDDVDYYVYYDYTYWYVGENGYDYDTYFDVFQGTIEKNTTYKATIYVNSIAEGYEFADDLKVFVNGEEVTDFYNMKFWVDVQYEIESIENTEEYTVESPTDEADATISFIEEKGEFYSFDIRDYLAITDEDIQKEIDLWNKVLEDDEKLTFEEVKAEFDKVVNYGKNAANGKGDLLKLYELYLYNNGDEVHEVDGGFKLRLKITDDMKGYDSYKLIYIAEDGTTEDAIELTKNGEYLEGTIPHLSMYALVGSKTETAEAPTSDTTDTNTEVEETKTETPSSNPKTGDNIAIWISLMVVSMLGVVGTVKFVKKNK